MDSKSISRKGVGVRVPALAPRSGAPGASDAALRALAEGLGRELAPTIAARVGALGERYRGLARRLRESVTREERHFAEALLDDDPFDETRALELARDEAAVVEAGYVLGVLAAACGVDVLRARRLEEGPRVLVELVAERFGRRLDPPPDVLPRAVPEAGSGWEATFALGALFAAAACPSPRPLEWRLTPEAGEGPWSLCFVADELPTAAFVAACEALAVTGVRATADGRGALLPGAWFRAC